MYRRVVKGRLEKKKQKDVVFEQYFNTSKHANYYCCRHHP